jgi:OOP family OmpA-OmpF porin
MMKNKRMLLTFFLLVACGDCFGQSSFQAITPGTSTRSDVASALGQPMRTISATVFEYKPPAGIGKIEVEYKASSAIADRVEVYFLKPISRSALIQKFSLPQQPEAKTTDAGGKLVEYFGGRLFLVLTYATSEASSGVSGMGYYSKQLFAGAVAELSRKPQPKDGSPVANSGQPKNPGKSAGPGSSFSTPAPGVSTSDTKAGDAGFRPGVRSIPTGQKVSLKGRIVRRAAETFNISDEKDMEMVVRLTDQTTVKSKGGFFRSGKNFDVTSLLRGLIVEVEGRGNEEGQLVAEKVRFDSSDLKVARTVESRVAPVEKENQRLAGQVDELNEVSKLVKGEAERATTGVAAANERISALDDYVVEDSVMVYFNVNSVVILPEYKLALDELARKAMNTKGYVIEIAGYADSSGDVERNRTLSQHRADAVVRYLQESHDIPLRRMITPFGYGDARPAADNTSAEGRRQNRRVEVKILVSRGMAQRG